MASYSTSKNEQSMRFYVEIGPDTNRYSSLSHPPIGIIRKGYLLQPFLEFVSVCILIFIMYDTQFYHSILPIPRV